MRTPRRRRARAWPRSRDSHRSCGVARSPARAARSRGPSVTAQQAR